MTADNTTNHADDAYAGGFVTGLLTARYWHLRNPVRAEFFHKPIPSDTPPIVYSLLSSMCRAAIDDRLFGTGGFLELDTLLLCETESELQSVLRTVPDARIQ
jgi:hypothetical protein